LVDFLQDYSKNKNGGVFLKHTVQHIIRSEKCSVNVTPYTWVGKIDNNVLTNLWWYRWWLGFYNSTERPQHQNQEHVKKRQVYYCKKKTETTII